MPQMFSQFFVQIFALYKFFRKNLRKKRRKFSMDPICDLVGEELEKPTQYKLSIFNLTREKFCNWFLKSRFMITKRLFESASLKT